MQIQSFKRINENDFPEQSKEMAKQLALSVNPTMETIVNTLNGKLVFGDNIKSVIKDITITVNSSAIPSNSTTVSLDFIPVGVILIDLYNNTTRGQDIKAAPFVQWYKTSGGITINKVYGLIEGNSYNLKLLVI